MACGIALSIIAELGTSPISSFPYVLSLISSFTVGTGTIAMNAGFMVLQMLLLRKHHDSRQLVQLPAAIVMGLLSDVFLYLLRGLSYSSYFGQWVYCALGIVLVAFSVSVVVTSRVIVMAGDVLAIAISTTLNRAFGPKKWHAFGNCNIAVDTSLVVIASVLSFAVLGRVEGVREGTHAAALLVGFIAKYFVRWMEPPAEVALSPTRPLCGPSPANA
ncbi:DUF6198 family protein [uncultured Corynebacterium sp.]|uniref:YczE/YyaS/YitT family protein n=1 Tax=uncultured Corynebacterium sp. TaxID=159447 RepID=UPI002621FC3D|nr:DUF6198 family protein [uncultured Corynebacterium sp.]